jgi:UDP-N-acetylglucosamine 1-carboxyvinyltransferase
LDKILVKGGTALRGRVTVSGAKNAALPAMAASLLTDEPVRLRNLPKVRDIQTTGRLLQEMGCQVDLKDLQESHGCELIARHPISCVAPYERVKTMRSSVLVLGPLLARFGRARVSLPGGCAIGARPIDLHIKGLKKLGASLTIQHGYVEAKAPHLKGDKVVFDRVTVTGTENLMMAACLAKGETILHNAAREPEVTDLADLLRSMGARIEGDGSSTIRIQGRPQLGGADHTIIPDRIEAGTFMVAGAITGGAVELVDCRPDHLTAIIEKLEETGITIERNRPDACRVTAPRRLQPRDVTTMEYPGFATDMQAQYMALMTQAHGASIITETIFESRYMHASELVRMGASIRIEGNRAIISGRRDLTGAKVLASDLRASASLVLAGLVARGETLVHRVYHLDRGYEAIEEKLRKLGASIQRITD